MNTTPLRKHWVIAPRIFPEAEKELQEFHPVLRQILANRGYTTYEAASRFLEARSPDGTEPYRMLGIPESVDRIIWALNHDEPITVYGDYDADGVTATALLVNTLKYLGGNASGYIPNRFDEGYGLNKEALESLYDRGSRLVITVDCGIRSPEEASFSRQLGQDLIISDHHHPAAELPEAFAIINPKQPGDPYPDKDLAGVGLAYKLASAISTNYESAARSRLDPETMLDLVALGTVADLAPLVGENRSLVKKGLEYIRRPTRQGIMALIGVSGLFPGQIDASHIGFALGPRLNAAGRLESALAALQLLTTSDVGEAARLAQQLEIQNRERQQITRQIQEQAEVLALAEDPDALLLFAAHPEFNPGVVGLAASRLSDVYYRPAIVAQLGDRFTRASCRSIPEFHITDALDQCAELLEHHGGHAAAAGFTVRNENLPVLVERLRSIANHELTGSDLRPKLYADLDIPLHELRPELLRYLEWLQPTGYGNRPVLFVSRELRVTSVRTVGKDSNHLRLSVSDGRVTYDGIAFGQGYWVDKLPPRVDLIYHFEKNEFNGRTSLQLNVRDIKPSRMAD